MMLNALVLKFNTFLKSDNDRSKNIFRNVLLSFGVKFGSIIISMMLMPLTINYVNPVQYGIWLTISSIVSWMSFFDIGLGQGLRNKLTNSLAFDKVEESQVYVSTTYALLTMMSIFLFIIFYFVTPLINWNDLFNIAESRNTEISFVVMVVLGSFCVQLIFQTINVILTATHEPGKANLITFLGQVGVILSVMIMREFIPGTLSNLVWALMLAPIIALIMGTIYFFSKNLSFIKPKLSKVNFREGLKILNLGGTFFIIQIGALLLFQSNNFIITKLLGPESVTEYNVAFKLFSVLSMVFTIILTPYWSAFTDAYAKNDFSWMRKSINNMRKVYMLLSFSAIVLYLLLDKIVGIWIGDSVEVTSALSLSMFFYIITNMWQTLHVYFLNGVGKIKMQLYAVIITSIINIPLAIFLGQRFGLPGIVASNTIIFLVLGFLFFRQSEMILEQKATGIWGL